MQDPHGEAGLAVRYGWFPADIVELSLLDFPPVTVKYPRQVFWQKDACEDGICHVSGSAPLALPAKKNLPVMITQ